MKRCSAIRALKGNANSSSRRFHLSCIAGRLKNGAFRGLSTQARPLRLAIVGSGPAGFYTAYRVMNKLDNALVDMYESLPVPFGLVRYGVAPDHPEVKNCQEKFTEVASSNRFKFIGSASVGSEIPLPLIRSHYDAVLLAYGADEDRRLGVPGETTLRNIHSARGFVGWYNGLPEHKDLNPNLDAGEEAVVIGQGNVALDVARILLTDVDVLKKTDITEYALEALSRSRVKRVTVVGRRGPMQASFTVKEVRELMNLPLVGFEPIEESLLPTDPQKLPRVSKRLAQIMSKGSTTVPETAQKSWNLSFLLSPVEFLPDASNPTTLGSVKFQKMALRGDVADPKAGIEPTTQATELPASLAFRSIGYRSRPLIGLSELNIPFDERLGIIPNDRHGRLISASVGPGLQSAGHIAGAYCAGWVKRGPTGVIASTMDDAFSTGDVIAQDWIDNVPFFQHGNRECVPLGWDGVKRELESSTLRTTSWEDWQCIDKIEQQRGAKLGKEREKLATVQDMLNVLD